MMLNHVGVIVRFADGAKSPSAARSAKPTSNSPSERLLRDFRLEAACRCGEFDVDGVCLEKRVLMPYGQNTVYVSYRLLSNERGRRCDELRAATVHSLSRHEAAVTSTLPAIISSCCHRTAIEISGGASAAAATLATAGSFAPHRGAARRSGVYRVESDRGYEWQGSVWCPGVFTLPLAEGAGVTARRVD